jgi:pimeloyl-ACP methyl ester carboxylesterase
MMATPTHTLDSRTLISADGSAIFTEAIGDPSRPAVIFGHGMCADCSVFDVLFDRTDVQRSIYAVRFDLRGHGRSASPETAAGYESARLVEDVQAIIAAFGLTKPFFAG